MEQFSEWERQRLLDSPAAGPPSCANIASLRSRLMCGEVLDRITLDG